MKVTVKIQAEADAWYVVTTARLGPFRDRATAFRMASDIAEALRAQGDEVDLIDENGDPAG